MPGGIRSHGALHTQAESLEPFMYSYRWKKEEKFVHQNLFFKEIQGIVFRKNALYVLVHSIEAVANQCVCYEGVCVCVYCAFYFP
jgi:hypothetical protein